MNVINLKIDKNSLFCGVTCMASGLMRQWDNSYCCKGRPFERMYVDENHMMRAFRKGAVKKGEAILHLKYYSRFAKQMNHMASRNDFRYIYVFAAH